VKGQLRLCSEGKCCETERFQWFLLAVPRMIYPGEKNSNCTNFFVHKDRKISVEVLNDDVEKVQVDQVLAVLEDGATFKANTRFNKSGAWSPWSHTFEMKIFDPEEPESWAYIRIEVKLYEHTEEQTYSNGTDTKISVKVPDDIRPPCTTNPLSDWLEEINGKQDLLSVKEMGTCYTYNIRNKNNQLQVMYNPPEGVPFKVKEIMLQSATKQTYCWRVKIKEPVDCGLWLNTTFDDTC